MFWFLREYRIERRAHQAVKEHNKAIAERHHLHRTFWMLHTQC